MNPLQTSSSPGRSRSLQRRLTAAVALGTLVAAFVLVAVASTPAGANGPYPDLGSCRVFPPPPAGTPANAKSLPDQTAWNQDISRAPRARNSAAVMRYIERNGGGNIHPDFGAPASYGMAYSVVGAGAPRLPIQYAAYGSESTPGPFPIPADAWVEGGPRSDGDRHVLAVDTSTCRLFELYRGFYKPSPSRWVADSGTEWDLGSAANYHEGWTSADAAGLPIFPGLARYDEAASGQIHHALRVTFESTRDAYIQPAVHCAGDTSSGAAPAMGTRLRLKAGYGLGGFSGAAKTIAEALKHYGLIVADNGSNWFISGTSDSRWADGNLNQLKRIPGSAFEVVASAAGVHPC